MKDIFHVVHMVNGIKRAFLLYISIFFSSVSIAQVTVNNPTNTTPNLAATYTTLADAVTALGNITAINGPVLITLNAGNPQTAPAGGYVIQFAATTTAINNISFAGSNNTITAFTPQVSGSLNDAIFKIIGADHISIQDFIMQENAINTNSSAASNNMTEFGVALLRASTSDGAQNNRLVNNVISLDRTYTNTFGIYSSVMHAGTDINPDDILNFTGSNSGNKIYGNSISNVNYGVVFMGSRTAAYMDLGNDIGGSSAATGNNFTNWGTGTAASSYPDLTVNNYCIYMNHGMDDYISFNTISSAVHTDINMLGGILKDFTTAQPSGTITSTYNNNTISLSKSSSFGAVTGIKIQGMNTPLTTSTIQINNNLISGITVSGAGSTSAITGISNASSSGVLNMNNNTVRGCESTGTVAAARFTGIENTGVIVSNVSISNNHIGDAISGAIRFSVSSAAQVFGIYNTKHPVGCTVIISGNDIRGIVHSVSSSGVQFYIANMGVGSVGDLVINGNTFTNLSVNTSGIVAFIAREGAMTAGVSYQCSNNSIVGSFSNSYAGALPGTLYFLFTQNLPSQSVNGSTVLVTGNNFSNVSVSGTGGVIGFYDLEGMGTMSGPSKTYTGNVLNNISLALGTIYSIYITNSGRVVCSTNVVSNVNAGGNIVGIWHGSTNGQGNDLVTNNTVNNLASVNANVVGIMAGSTAVPDLSVSGNSVSGLSSTGTTNVQLVGIEIIQGTAINISNNTINNIQASGTGASTFAYGTRVNTGSLVKVYQNRIYDIRHTGATTGGNTCVIGIQSLNPNDLTIHNNFVADLKAPASTQLDAIRGININALGANTSYKLYYNSVFLNATSSGANFGTSGIFHTGNATATTGRLEMINNIIVNTSTENGTGITAAFRRSNTTLTNFALTSDHNLFYAGTPAIRKLIYYDGTNSDQTLSAYQTRVATRDVNSISLMPQFVSATDLHLTPANCGIDGKGTPLSITTDIDNAVRSSTSPDIGADEFSALYGPALAGIAAAAVCDNKTVDPSGTTYGTINCELIARIVPSGADPVAGKINTCVTLDPTQQYFNGEPYVQRHYDLEPVVSNQTTTSATVTMYFTDAEFVLYNTTNPVWPQLPTIAGGGNGDPRIANVKVTQFHGTPTGGLPTTTPGNYTGARVLLTPVSVTLNGSVWEVTVNISGFSGFYVHTNAWNAPLPVTVNYFTGIKQGSAHMLNWKVTCNSSPRVTMQLERSADSRNFVSRHTITTGAARCDQPFDHTDAEPLPGMNYYRLKLTDANGKITYSSIVALLNAAKGFEIVSIAPNPVDDQLNLNIASAKAGRVELVILDIQGRPLIKQNITLIAGFNNIRLRIGHLPAGTYQVYMISGVDRPGVSRFVKR